MMRIPLDASFRALLRPGTAFEALAPPLAEAAWKMVRIWVPLALLNAGWTAWRTLQAYESLRRGSLPAGLLGWFGWDPAELHDLLLTLPPPPVFARVWPWLLLAVPVGVLGTWLHHAVWDHTGLWLLGGLRRGRGFRTSLLAEAEALRITAVGTLLGLLGFLPILGPLLALPLAVVEGYLWLFRGFALAARHGCESWRGVAATVVHAVLLGCFALGLMALMLAMVRTAA